MAEVQGATELAAMAGKAFQKSNDKKLKKQQRNEQAAAGGARNGFRAGSDRKRPPKVSASASAASEEDGDDDGEERAARAAAAASRKGKKAGGGGSGKAPSNQWKYIAFLILICGGAVQVVVPLLESLFGGGGGSGSSASAFAYPPVAHTKIDVDDVEQVRRVFFSGESWMVLCNNHTTGETVNAVFERAAAMLHHTERAANAHHIFTAVMPCYERLPSGKTVFERWEFERPSVETVDLDDPRLPKRHATSRDGKPNELKHTLPTAFFVANGDKPQPLARSFFGYRHRDDAVTTTAHKMAEHVRAATKPRSLVTVTSSTHLTKYCTQRRHCALFLYRSDDYKMPEAVRRDINDLCGRYRSLRCVALDTVRYASSLAKALPAVPTGEAEWPRLVLTKKLTPDELKALAEETAAAAAATAAAAPAPTPEEAAAQEAEASNPSRTVNPKAKVLNSIGLLAKAHRGAWHVPALASFVEATLGLVPAWPTADEAPLRAFAGPQTADDKRMTQLHGWPTVTARPYSELPKKKKAKKAAAPKTAAKKPAAAAKAEPKADAKPEAAAAAADAKPVDPAAAAAAQAAAEKAARERIAREEAEYLPQAADESDAAAAAAAAAAAPVEEDEVDLDA